MSKRKKIIIAILVVILAWFGFVIGEIFLGSPDLTQEDKTILVLALDKYEQSGGGCDMAYLVYLENGSLANYTPVYPGGMSHPSVSATGGLSGNLMLHDCMMYGADDGMEYAKEIVAARQGVEADAVVAVYDEGLDNIIDSIRPLTVDGEVTNLTAADIIRENDAYNGYKSNGWVTGTMSRADAVMVLVKALSQAAKDPNKKATMIQSALTEYNNGNIIMRPDGSFKRLLATKGFESLAS
ncbi:DUF4012 domain-containing protein [uncultured Methanobrevibacter sp.]|uniref:DUF4012 domain-containing protein n=1 Tax=uncultured Methanobrevibacter sp. TaxID=253161 RepID=UPI0026351A35